jgi:hypothetical protein
LEACQPPCIRNIPVATTSEAAGRKGPASFGDDLPLLLLIDRQTILC